MSLELFIGGGPLSGRLIEIAGHASLVDAFDEAQVRWQYSYRRAAVVGELTGWPDASRVVHERGYWSPVGMSDDVSLAALREHLLQEWLRESPERTVHV